MLEDNCRDYENNTLIKTVIIFKNHNNGKSFPDIR